MTEDQEIYKQRFLNLIKSTEDADPEYFTMGNYVHDCGSPACVIGNYATRDDLQSDFFIEGGELRTSSDGCMIGHADPSILSHFGITDAEADLIFSSEGCRNASNPHEAVTYLKQFFAKRYNTGEIVPIEELGLLIETEPVSTLRAAFSLNPNTAAAIEIQHMYFLELAVTRPSVQEAVFDIQDGELLITSIYDIHDEAEEELGVQGWTTFWPGSEVNYPDAPITSFHRIHVGRAGFHFTAQTDENYIRTKVVPYKVLIPILGPVMLEWATRRLDQ